MNTGPTSHPFVPPRRLGALLSSARVDRGLSLSEAAQRLGGGWSSIEVLEVEAGRRLLDDSEISMFADQYGVTVTDLIPPRSRLVVDVRERTVALADVTYELDDAGNVRSEVLSRYVALICSMRGITPGGPIGLRVDDLEVLASVLSSTPEQIRTHIDELLSSDVGRVESLWQRARGRVLVPAVGVVVAATAIGTLLLVPTVSASGENGRASEGPVVIVGPAQAGPAQANGPAQDESAHVNEPAQGDAAVEIGEAVLQERLEDGRPGPVTVRD